MIKLLHIEITDCEECPLFDNDERPYCNSANRNLPNDDGTAIPDWCPLPTYREGGKF